MSVAIYPTPPNSLHVGETTGPPYLKLLDHPPDYPSNTMHEFKDGGASYGAANTNAVLRFEFEYDGLTSAQAAVLDAHVASAKGILTGFTFRHPRTDVLYSDVHYENVNAERVVLFNACRLANSLPDHRVITHRIRRVRYI